MRQGGQRPEQEAASQFPFQGLNIEADDNVRMVAEDGQSHKVSTAENLFSPLCVLGAPCTPERLTCSCQLLQNEVALDREFVS